MSISIKKPFVEFNSILSANKDKTVEEIYEQLLPLMISKKQESVAKYDEAGKLTHIFCYYHKVWENVETVEYGSKKHSKTGLNSMCKIGVNRWTKQQATFKNANEQLLTDLLEGRIDREDVLTKKQEIADARIAIVHED